MFYLEMVFEATPEAGAGGVWGDGGDGGDGGPWASLRLTFKCDVAGALPAFVQRGASTSASSERITGMGYVVRTPQRYKCNKGGAED